MRSKTNRIGIEVKAALKQLAQWHTQGFSFSISVNISPQHLQHPSFIIELKTYLSAYPDFKPESLDLEIVESSALNDFELVSNSISECKSLGVIFSIDDFGAGCSSLVYLRCLPVKYLKIDQSFVCDILIDIEDKSIIEGIIELAKVFKLTVIVEGVPPQKNTGLSLLSQGVFLYKDLVLPNPYQQTRLKHG